MVLELSSVIEIIQLLLDFNMGIFLQTGIKRLLQQHQRLLCGVVRSRFETTLRRIDVASGHEFLAEWRNANADHWMI